MGNTTNWWHKPRDYLIVDTVPHEALTPCCSDGGVHGSEPGYEWKIKMLAE